MNAHAKLPQNSDEEFERVMDATQTLILLRAGEPLTQEQVDDLHLLDEFNRRDEERSVDAFHRGYQAGLERGGGADVAKLIEERDSARNWRSVANAMSSAAEYRAFREGAQTCREMMARFVEQGGDTVTAGSIRANWNPTWGDDPGAPNDEHYQNAKPCEISARDGATAARAVAVVRGLLSVIRANGRGWADAAHLAMAEQFLASCELPEAGNTIGEEG